MSSAESSKGIVELVVVWKGRDWVLTPLANKGQAFWREAGEVEKKSPSTMPKGLQRAWREQTRGKSS